jgi:hypothetical protein
LLFSESLFRAAASSFTPRGPKADSQSTRRSTSQFQNSKERHFPQQGWYARACSDNKELIKRWSRIRVRQPRYCILKITASSLRSRLRKLWRATIGITPARRPRLLPQRRKKSPRAKNHGPRGKAGPGFLVARVYRERIIDRVCFRLKNHQSLRRRARRSRMGWMTMLGAVRRALRTNIGSYPASQKPASQTPRFRGAAAGCANSPIEL